MSDEIVRLLTEIRDLLAEQTSETARDTPQEEPPRRLNAWHVAEWDDVWWWVADRLDQIQPDLRGMA